MPHTSDLRERPYTPALRERPYTPAVRELIQGCHCCFRHRSGETASCTVVFVVIYYFTMAALLWFVMLCYAWHVTFRALGTPRDDLSSKTAYFHLVSWSIPLVLTIVCLAISEVCVCVCVCV